MSTRDFLLALAVVAVWGTNFVVIRLGLDQFPPLLFGALRFTLALLPAALVIRKPPVTWGNLAAYGLLIGFGQFGLLFLAINGHISPGLASLVIQVQVFFTVGLSVWLAGERLRWFHGAALLLGALGIVVIASNTDANTTALGLALVLLAALSWAGGNLVSKAGAAANMLAYVVWASLFAAPPLFILSVLFEGWPAISRSLVQAGPGGWAAVLWQSVGNTMFGYAAWGWLLNRYPAATVAPMALLVPVFGMAASAWELGEPFPPWKLEAALLVLAGLAVNLLAPLWARGRGKRVRGRV